MSRLPVLVSLAVSVSACAPRPYSYAPSYASERVETGTLEQSAFPATPVVVQDQRKAHKIAQQGQEGVANSLRDPGSAQFRNGSVVKIGDEDYLVCTEVNGRNGYGGYVGYTMAVARVTHGAAPRVYIATTDTKYGANAGADAAVRTVCQQPSPPLSGAPFQMGKAAMSDLKRSLQL